MKQSIFFSIFLLSGCYLHGMHNNPELNTYHEPAQNGIFRRDFLLSAVHRIQAEEELQDSGTIVGLVVRPKSEYRQMVSSCKVTKTHIEGDKHKELLKDQELHAVTLMRADVSQALGGMHIPGDNIHVKGLRMGRKYISEGDLLTVCEPGNKELIRAVFLLTAVEYTACLKLESRAGKHAYDFLNAEGIFRNTLIKTPKGKLLNGPEQRLRGLRLAVIYEGIVELGHDIFIEKGAQRNQRLVSLGMVEYAAELLIKARPVAQTLKAQDERRAAYREAQKQEVAKK